MIDSLIEDNLEEARSVLEMFIADDTNKQTIVTAGDTMVEAILSGNKIISCGNGGSSCDAAHFAEEMTGRFRNERRSLPAIAINDASHITCTANDYGYESIFSRFIEGLGKKGDILLAISTSGNSKNILKAAEAARAKGLKVISLTGKSGGSLRPLSDVNINVAHDGWADRVQEIHIKIIHILIDYIEHKLSL
ncbi:MAG: D-sedoheptulose 7-phosphate isomerase [Bacteroidales bacterium]|jgi:D-sedoheptulose 7-phosphate isomerase|nr:D-sedoheptulose 7-phosphate isomerase [Bacteroidales bacterium]